MGKASRDKGKRGEREVAHLWRQYGWHAERTRQAEGDNDPDVRVRVGEGHPEVPIWVEVKRYQKIAAVKWLGQAFREAHFSHVPALFMREDEGAWVTMVSSEFFLECLAYHPKYQSLSHQD